MGKTKDGTVQSTGAPAGAILIGASHHNKGLLLQVEAEQPMDGKRIDGAFTILAEGQGEYRGFLEKALNNRFNSAAELIAAARTSGAVKCTHIVNRNCLKIAAVSAPAHIVEKKEKQPTKVRIQTNRLQYDVAISFAGEDREVARALAKLLVDRDVNVFFDEYEKAGLWAKDLYQHLAAVYSNYSRYCIVLISRHYKRKNWTRHELRHAQERALREHREYILPVKIDDTELAGLPATICYQKTEI